MKRLVVFFILSCFLATALYSNSFAADDEKDVPYELKDVEKPPKVIKTVEPVFPREAKRKFTEGKVIVKIVVTKEGSVKFPSVISSLPEGIFDECAMKAIKQWRFEPALKNGKPVDTIVLVPMVFNLIGVTGTGYDAYTEIEHGLGFMNTGDYKKAIAAFSKAINYFPNLRENSVTYNYRGFTYRLMGDYKKALHDFNRAIDLDSNFASAYKNRGETLVSLEKYEDALIDYSQAIHLNPDLDQVYNSRGDIFRQIGKHEDAVRDYSELIRLKPDIAYAYLKRGYSYNKLDDIDNACKDFAKACELGDCRAIETLNKEGKCQ